MADLYETIRKSMFAYFCKHHSNIIHENFAVPRKLKITKKSPGAQPKRYYLSERTAMALNAQMNCLDAKGFADDGMLALEHPVVVHKIC